MRNKNSDNSILKNLNSLSLLKEKGEFILQDLNDKDYCLVRQILNKTKSELRILNLVFNKYLENKDKQKEYIHKMIQIEINKLNNIERKI